MPRTVVLKHTLPDASWHYDWMLEVPASASEQCLRTFRIDSGQCAGPHLVGTTEFRGLELERHRAAYLEYEGDIGGGRGAVRRVAEGTYESLSVQQGSLSVRMCCDGRTTEWAGSLAEGREWVFARAR